MNLQQYFTDKEGIGILSTADSSGKVNAAVYSRPHLLDDGYITFIMRNRRTKSNLDSNPHAHYLFMEKKNGYSGVRIQLEKVKEVQDAELIEQLSHRKKKSCSTGENCTRFLVSFKITQIIELVGDKEITLE